MTQGRWWELHPGVLQAEEDALARISSSPPVLDEDLLASAGVREYRIQYSPPDGPDLDLSVTYSDFHPYFRVEVTADQLVGTHQQPFRGDLCLLRGGSAAWDVEETAADLIEDQLPKLLADVTATGLGRVNDADDGDANPEHAHVEPYVNYYTAAPRTVVRVDGGWPPIREVHEGELLIAIDGGSTADALRGSVLEVRATDGVVLRSASDAVLGLYEGGSIAGRWCRLPARPSDDGPDGVLDAAIAVRPELARRQPHSVGDVEYDIVGVVFEDDIRADLSSGAVERGDAWLFAVRARTRSKEPRAKARPAGRGRGRVTPAAVEDISGYLARADRAGPTDMRERNPALSPMGDHSVALFGLGGLGAPSAIEMAKAGLGGLHLVEWDYLSAGNAARWPLGFVSGGLHKLEALGQHLRSNWPHTIIEPHGALVGQPRRSADEPSQLELLDAVLADVSLIYDATADVAVNYFLSETARERGLPYIVVSATEGGWGGMVARFRPDPGAACWTCLMHHLQDGSLPSPPADPEPATRNTWPAGCTDPTFAGTGFDIGTIALAGVRMVASTLCEGHLGAYPRADWDYATFSFRNDLAALPGGADPRRIERHPDCAVCRIH